MEEQGKKFSIAALVLGIVCIVGAWIPVVCYFTTICAILGIIFGVKGRKLCGDGNKGLATAGLVLGIIGAACAAIGIICSICVLAAAGSALGALGTITY